MVTELTDRDTRHLVAVNADIVGFSRLMADDAAGTEETVEDYRSLVEAQVEAASGTLVNFVGDNFMAVFDDATDAIGAAIAISAEVEARNAQLPQHRWVRFRMGIDQGEVTSTADRYFGDALNIAARIQEKAPPGGVSVSGRVFEALDEPALRFRPVGRLALKNIPEPVDIFEFADLPGDGATPAGASRLLSLAAPTLVVLPIHAETVGEQVRAVAEVIRSELLHRLTTMSRLTVIDGEAVGPAGPAPAQYMVETGVHEVGDQVRVYAKVIHVATMNIVTSHKWATTVDGLFALTDTISDEIERGVAIELVIGEQARLFSSIDDPEATQKIYQGWFQLTRDTYDGWLEAVKAFEEVDAVPPRPGLRALPVGVRQLVGRLRRVRRRSRGRPRQGLRPGVDRAGERGSDRPGPHGPGSRPHGPRPRRRGRRGDRAGADHPPDLRRDLCAGGERAAVSGALAEGGRPHGPRHPAERGPPGLVPDGAGLLAVHRWAARPGGGHRRGRARGEPGQPGGHARAGGGPGRDGSRPQGQGNGRADPRPVPGDATSTTGYAPTRSRTRSSSTGGGTISPDWACSQERPAS